MKILLKKFWKQNVLVMIILALLSMVTVSMNLISAKFYNAILTFQLRPFLITFAEMLVIYLLYVACTYLKFKSTAFVSQQMMHELRNELVQQLSQTDYEGFHQRERGQYIS